MTSESLLLLCVPSNAESTNRYRRRVLHFFALAAIVVLIIALVALSIRWRNKATSNAFAAEFDKAWESLDTARIDDAERYLESLMRQPQHGDAYLVLDGYLCLSRKDFEAAEKRIQIANPTGRLRPYALEILGRTFYGQQRWYDAERAFATLGHEVPQSFAAHFWLGVVYDQLHMFGQAAHEGRLASEIQPNDPRPRILLGSIFFRHGRYRAAVEQYEQALASMREETKDNKERTNSLMTSLVKSLVLDNKFEEALQKIELVGIPSIELQTLRAECLLGLGRLAEAEQECRKVLEQEENQQLAAITLAKIGLQQTVTLEHIQLLEAVLSRNPNNYEAVFLLSQVYGKLGNQKGQQECLEKSQRLMKAHARIQSLMNIVWAKPQEVDARQELADLFAEVGDVVQAEQWRQAASACRSRLELIKRDSETDRATLPGYRDQSNQ